MMIMVMMMTMAVMITIAVTMAMYVTRHDMLCGLGGGRREGEKEREEGYTRKGAW